VSRLGLSMVAACSMLLFVQFSAPADRDEAAPVIDNNRVTVFDVTLNRGNPWTTPQGTNFAEMFLVGGKIRTTTPAGNSRTVARKSGEVVYIERGTVATLETISKGPARIIIVELKDLAVPPLPNNSRYPLAFPRPGATKVFENDRIVAWNLTWKLGVPTAVHYHDKDVVIVFRDSGSIKSTQLNGESTVADDEFGTIRFSKSNRIHSEELVKGKEGAIVLELK
jgi:hypothetical protein